MLHKTRAYNGKELFRLFCRDTENPFVFHIIGVDGIADAEWVLQDGAEGRWYTVSWPSDIINPRFDTDCIVEGPFAVKGEAIVAAAGLNLITKALERA